MNVELTDAWGVVLWILGVMFNHDREEFNLETSLVKHVEKLLQDFLHSILTKVISYYT